MAIKAIETRYKGYRFRSRLEARWAVLFNALGIDFFYELEGLILDDGVRYLPDFFLPDWGYLEIKPFYPGDDYVFRLLRNKIMIAIGEPYIDMALLKSRYRILRLAFHYYYLGDGNSIDIDANLIVECPVCHSYLLEGDFYHIEHEPDYLKGLPCGPGSIQCHCGKNNKKLLATNRLQQAYISARSARFEFGEQG